MFQRKTVFIVGAGASEEVGFPIGATLAEEIQRLLTFKHDWPDELRGDPYFLSAMEWQARQNDDFNAYFGAAKKIADGTTTVKSIDNFLNNHSGDAYVTACGKAALMCSILRNEKRSLLYLDPSKSREKLNHTELMQTWYHKFGEILANDCHKNKIDSIFTNITIICFNYDRTIEQFLTYFLSDSVCY